MSERPPHFRAAQQKGQLLGEFHGIGWRSQQTIHTVIDEFRNAGYERGETRGISLTMASMSTTGTSSSAQLAGTNTSARP